MKKKKKAESIGDLIRNYAKSMGTENEYLQAKIVNNWTDIVGKAIANVTIKLYFNNFKLFIKVDSATVKNELTILKQALIIKINRYVSKEIITDIIFI
ncbi:MAG: DUF721 domain-containing protein [Bacteroidota bacterium]|nr:DUF721 domain-containing protein [Bacteroidota bacterium]